MAHQFILLVLGAILAAVVTGQRSTGLPTSGPSVFIPWNREYTSAYTPAIKGRIGTKHFHFPTDTGSTGLMIGEKRFGNLTFPSNRPGWEFLSTSGLLNYGQYVDMNITLFASNGDTAVSRVPVLVVTKQTNCLHYESNYNGICPEKYVNKTFVQNLTSITYFGVGFGRKNPPELNPLLNVVSINGKPATNIGTGYGISTQGITLGLTTGNTQNARWMGLPKQTDYPDSRAWALPQGEMKINGGNPFSMNGALFDTGVNKCQIQSDDKNPLPEGSNRQVKTGTTLSFAFPSFSSPVGSYGYTVGPRTNKNQPTSTWPLHGKPSPLPPPTFVNTGRNVLFSFSFFFDAINGRIGFR